MSRTTDNDPLLGRVLDGKFTLQSVLGRGGMGVVYRAHQATLERPVALKLMRALSGDDDAERRETEFQRRFFLEAATAAKLKHPNTITVFDYGSTNVDGEKVFYITMELLDGVTLSKLLQNEGPLPPLRAVNIALQICRSLREAHAAGIVHRDLKPGNVMLVKNDDDDDDDGGDGDFVKVLDFGLAKSKAPGGSPAGPQLTKAGTFLGSPRYVAPEQIEGQAVDGRADIYSFGCVMYRMLTGRVPFDGQQPVEVMLKHLKEDVPPMNRDGIAVPDGLEQLVLRCLAKKAADRPTSMDDVIGSLKRARGELSGAFSGSINIPEELRERLRAELLASPLVSGPHPVPGANDADKPKESTSPTSAAPAPDTSPGSSPVGPTSAARLASAEWRIGGDSASDSTRPGRLTVVPRPRRTWPAVVAGVVLGLFVAGGVVAQRTGALDVWLQPVLARWPGTPPATPKVPLAGPRAIEATAARVRIKTTPVGADVFEVTAEGTALIGITPLTVTWQVDVGDGGREFLLKKPGFIPSRARVDPPPASPNGEPVWLDVEATLRALPSGP
jgi:serine/threonine protein kinase